MRPLANYIDHTLLAADTTEAQIKTIMCWKLLNTVSSLCVY